jgi:hypothetical protein
MSATIAAHIAARDAALQAQYDAAPDKTLVIDPAHYLEQVLRERSDLYAAHVAAMDIAPEMTLWAMAMGKKYGSYVKVWHYVADWITALLIIRYGEEPRATHTADGTSWPLAFSSDDTARAMKLLKGEKWPADALTLLGSED